MRKYVPISDIPDYSGAAVYALVDDDGKRYIGSTKNANKRIKQHYSRMKNAKKKRKKGLPNDKIASAVKSGKKFRCEILLQINADVTNKELREFERILLSFYGGIENTYNKAPIKHKV